MKDKKFSKLILMENGIYKLIDTKEDLVMLLLGDDYYKLSDKNKNKRLEVKSLANSLGKQIDFTYINDEIAYIYWLLINSNVVLLERLDSNIFTKGIDKSNINDDYIIVNTFAEKLLKDYLRG